MKKWFSLIAFLLILSSARAQFIVSSSDLPAFEVTPQKGTGLEQVFVVYGIYNATIEYHSDSDAPMTWASFSSKGLSETTPLSDYQQNGSVSTLYDVKGDRGYVVTQNGKMKSIWLIDYLPVELELTSLTVDESEGLEAERCEFVRLLVEGDAPNIGYHSVSGAQWPVAREFEITYNTLEWSEESRTYSTVEKIEQKKQFEKKISITAPFCDTPFKLSGDQMLRFWNMTKSLSTDTYKTVAVCVNSIATQAERDSKNEWDNKKPDGNYGGSAPVEIEFAAFPNYPVATHCELQFSKDQSFEVIDLKYPVDYINHTFNEEGTTYVRFVTNSTYCEAISEVYTVTVGESKLEAPNIFTPETTPGMNDIWKVGYKSIVRFKCWIFDRYGVQMFYFDNPANGWDGKYRGKLVLPGVYFYVIEAKGADGKNYKLKGDINILRSKN